MKSIFASNNKKRDSKVFGMELLNEKEMLNVRGGTTPIIPSSRPKDAYDFEEE